MASKLFFVLTVTALAAARPSDSDLNSEDNGRIYRDSAFMLDDQRFTDGQLEQGRVFASTEHPWDKGVVYYVIDPSIAADCIAIIKEAIAHIVSKSLKCVTFIPRTDQRNYIRIYKGTGCWSLIGMNGGQQDISLGDGCCHRNIVIHEFLHALGMFHEQQHPGRDEVIKINWDKIIKGYESQFNKMTANPNITFPFDRSSLMLYGATAFSVDGTPTMTMIDPNVDWPEHSEKDGMSAGDCKMVQSIYCCKYLLGYGPCCETGGLIIPCLL